MIRGYRLRRLLAPTAGLWRAVWLFVLGLLALLLGAGLSFKGFIEPQLENASGHLRAAFEVFVDPSQVEDAMHNVGGLLLLLGLIFTYRGFRSAVDRILATLNPGLKSGRMDIYVRRQQLAQGPRIVAMGGGTGLSTLLRGLKSHSSNITAIVTVTDDGGSSGRLVQEKGMIPPGDIRNCLVALADAEKAMTELFQHRFKDDSGSLSGHSMGNLLIAALVDQARGDFEEAVERASDVLAIRGRVVPSTLEHVRLRAVLEGGVEVCGETAIAQAGKRIERLHLDPVGPAPYAHALEAIRNADLVCIGPGSVFTSVIPNLLVPGMVDALRECRGLIVYVCNVMTQPGESEGFTASEHVAAILRCVESRVFDHVMVNTGVPSQEAIVKYRESGQHLVEADIDRLRPQGLRVIAGNFMSESDVVRHDPMKVASRLMALLGG